MEVVYRIVVTIIFWGSCSGLSLVISPISPIYEGQQLSVICTLDFVIKQNENLRWTVNGSAASGITKDISLQLIRKDKKGIMTIPSITLELNNTEVMCSATSIEGTVVLSGVEIILVEGIPMAVDDLRMDVKKDKFNLSWKSPFTYFKDSISYCIYIVTQVSRHVLESQCGLKTQSIEYAPVNYATLYEATVIPVNRLGNGTSLSVFPSLPEIINNCTTLVLEDTFIVQVECSYNDTVVKGLLVLLLYNNPNGPHKRGEIQALNSTRKNKVLLSGKVNGLHYITVHPIMKSSNKLGTRIPFGTNIHIPGPNIAQTDIPTTVTEFVASTTSSVSTVMETITSYSTQSSFVTEVTTSIPTFFTFTNTATIIGCSGYILGLIPGLIIGVCCGYKLWRGKVEAYPLTPSHLPPSPRGFMTVHPHQIPPRLLSPLSRDPLAKLPPITLPPLHQPLPAINYGGFTDQISGLPPSIVYLPPLLPPINHSFDQQPHGTQPLCTLQSNIPNSPHSTNAQTLADIAQFSSTQKKNQSLHRRRTVKKQEECNTKDNMKSSRRVLRSKNDMDESDKELISDIEEDMNQVNSETSDLSSSEETSHEIPINNVPDSAPRDHQTSIPEQKISVPDETDVTNQPSKSNCHENNELQISLSSRSSHSSHERNVQVPLTDTIWPQTLD